MSCEISFAHTATTAFLKVTGPPQQPLSIQRNGHYIIALDNSMNMSVSKMQNGESAAKDGGQSYLDIAKQAFINFMLALDEDDIATCILTCPSDDSITFNSIPCTKLNLELAAEQVGNVAANARNARTNYAGALRKVQHAITNCTANYSHTQIVLFTNGRSNADIPLFTEFDSDAYSTEFVIGNSGNVVDRQICHARLYISDDCANSDLLRSSVRIMKSSLGWRNICIQNACFESGTRSLWHYLRFEQEAVFPVVVEGEGAKAYANGRVYGITDVSPTGDGGGGVPIRAASDFLRQLPGYGQCAEWLLGSLPLSVLPNVIGHGDGLLVLAPSNDALASALSSLDAPELSRLALAHVMIHPAGASPLRGMWALNPTCPDPLDRANIMQTVFGLRMADGTYQRIAPDSARQLSDITQINEASVADRHVLSDANVTILCVSSLMMSLALDVPLAKEQMGGLDAKCPVPPPGLNVLGADGHALLDVEARLYGEASGEPIRPKPTPAADERRKFDGKLIPESELFGHCPDLRLRGKTKEQQLQPVFIQKLQSAPTVRQVLQDTSPELHVDERIATRGSNPSNIYTPRIRLQADSGAGVRRALYYKTTTRVTKAGRVVCNHADFLKIGLKPYAAHTLFRPDLPR